MLAVTPPLQVDLVNESQRSKQLEVELNSAKAFLSSASDETSSTREENYSLAHQVDKVRAVAPSPCPLPPGIPISQSLDSSPCYPGVPDYVSVAGSSGESHGSELAYSSACPFLSRHSRSLQLPSLQPTCQQPPGCTPLTRHIK